MKDLWSVSPEQRFQWLVGAVTDYAIFMLDPEGRIVTWNAGAERAKGYTADEVIGHHYSRFFTPEDQTAELPNRALRIAAREGRYEAEGWRVRKNGERFWANAVIDPVRADDGTLLGFAKVTRDITERKEAERALFSSEQRFRMLVQGVRDYAIYMLDREGHVSNWNAGAESIKGYKADEIVGRHFSQFYTEGDRAKGEPARALQIALDEGKYERESWRVRKDGSLFWAHVLIDPIYDEDGEHVGFAKVTRDATAQKKAREELEEARAALAQSQKLQALGELTGGIAHDFNNLMTVVSGSADFLLKNEQLPVEKRRHHLTAIAETAKRAIDLTDHLLAFGRRQRINPQVIDLKERLGAFADILSRTIGSKIEFTLQFSDEVCNVEVDGAQLETAILNAAVNARDAMPDGGALTISIGRVERDEQQFVAIRVSDTGLGMPERVLERAFEPFFTTKEVGKGTGLGLSQIHGFAAQAGGWAEIESREGEGTTVSLILPCTDKAVASEESQDCSQPLPEGVRVLLIEDNAQVREFADAMLNDLGCEVTAVANGDEALAAIEQTPIDLVVSDVVLPGISGLEIARHLSRIRPHLPVLLTTGYSEETIDFGGEFPLLPKPYRARELSSAMAAALARSTRSGEPVE